MASSSQAASSSSSSSLGQSALYLCAKEDNNGVFRRTKKGFEDRIATAASSGLGSDCLVSESILAVESYIKNNYPNGLSRLYIRAHGDQTKGRGFSLTLKSTADGGVISLSTSGKQLKTLKRICQAVQPGGTLIVEGCYSGLGKNNLLKFLAGLCNPDVLVVGSKGSAFEVGFDPILNMHTRFTDVMTKKDLTRVYYTKSGKAQNIPIDQFNILWDFLRNKIAPDDSKTLQMAYRLCYQLLGERNNLEALVKIREENKDLIASLLQDPEDVRTDFKAMTFSKKDASPVWQEMLRELENASDVFNHHGEKEFPITPESKRGLIATSKGVSFHNHSTRYIAAYQFLLGCAAIEKHKTIGILYDNGDKRTIENPGAMIMHSVSDQTIHTDELSLTEILSKEFPRFKESYLLAKKHRSEEPGLVKEWLTKIIGPERGGCLDKYIERNYYFHLTRLNIDNTLGLKVAIQNNNLETFKRHLNSQADLNHVYADGRTILDIALQEGSSSIIAYLVLAFPEDRFPALMQDIQAKVNPIKKANTLYVIYKHLHKQGRIAEAQDLRDQVQRATEQVLIMKEASPDSLLKARMLNGASQVLEEIGDLVKAEHVRSKVFQTLIELFLNNYGEDIQNLPCTAVQIEKLLRRAQAHEDTALVQFIKVTPPLSFLHKQSAATIRAWLNNPANSNRLRQIKDLNLSKKKLKILPPEIGLLTGLQNLNLQRNKLTSLPDSIGKLTSLTKLWLGDNKLESLPDEIGKLTALTKLELSENLLESLPGSIGNLTSLTKLWLNYNELQSLPDEIGNLTALTQLDLGNNQLQSLSASIGNLTALTQLDLGNNQLQSLSASIGNLTALTQLDLGNNQLQSLPDWIGNLTALTELYLFKNHLQGLPESIGNLTALTGLWLNFNQLQNLPDAFSNLTALTQLDLSINHLQSLPDEFGNLTHLNKFWLEGNQLQSLPDGFCNLTALTELWLNNNQLQSLPDGFGSLTALSKLVLSENQLQSLPGSIGNLTALTEFWLMHNKLTALPVQIGNLSALKTIDLSYNQLTALPEQIGNLNALHDLSLEGNPIMFISDHQLEKHSDLQTILAHYHEFKTYPTQSSLGNLFKLIAPNEDPASIQSTFEELDPALKQKIAELAGIAEAPAASSLTTISSLTASIFVDIPRLGYAIREAPFEMFNLFSFEQKNSVYTKIWELAGSPETDSPTIWGEKHAFDKMLRFVDALEAVRAQTT